jgi:hypothetical protein
MVPRTGIEPARSCEHWILSPACLPVSASRLLRYYILMVVANSIPSAQEMEQQIENGANSPQPMATAVPEVTSTNQAQTPYLANAEDTTQATEIKSELSELITKAHNLMGKVLPIGLMIQGLYGIYKSIHFIFVGYPELNFLLASHQITQTQVNDFVIKAIMIAISTLLSMIFAMRLAVMKTKVVKTFNTLIGILLVLGNAAIHDYFEALQASDYILAGINWFIDFLISLPVLIKQAMR